MRLRGSEEVIMLRRLGFTAAFAMFVVIGMSGAGAADPGDARAAREREMLRRAQEALRQSQEENADLGRSKADAEQKLKDAASQLDSARNASKSTQAALKVQLQSAAAAQADLKQQLERAQQQIALSASQQQETAKRLGARESELKQTQQDLQLSKAASASCEAKNLQLYEYSTELVQRYQKKGVWSALTQKEPVFGIKEVRIENVVQEYQEKLASQKITPAAAPANPASNGVPPAGQKPAH
jgi:chromosome segregation ATPase